MNLALLKETFANFVRAHRMEHHFRRMAILDMFRSAPVEKELSSSHSQALMAAAVMPVDALLHQLGSRQDGLTDSEADAIRDKVGPNEVEHEKPLPWWLLLWNCYRNPFNLLLSALEIISYLTEDMKATIVIGTMVALSTVLRFVQEARSNQAAAKLKEIDSNQCPDLSLLAHPNLL